MDINKCGNMRINIGMYIDIGINKYIDININICMWEKVYKYKCVYVDKYWNKYMDRRDICLCWYMDI